MKRCICGVTACGNRNRGHFYVLIHPDDRVRALVFVWPYRGFWTWCPVVNDEPQDTGSVMGHYDSLQLAWADADAWTRGAYGATREEAA